MTDKPTPTTDLLKRCAEIHEWRSTGVLSGEALRDYAKRNWPDRRDALQMAEHETVTEALALLAKWGQPAQAAEPVAWLRNTTDPQPHAVTNLKYRSAVDAKAGVEYIPVFAAPQPVEREPLDEARRLFGAGWKAAALFCDREDVVVDGIIGFGACPQFEAAFSAAHGSKGGQHGTE